MGIRILLVDDHQILREGIRRGFESAGHEIVGEAGNGAEGVELAVETRPEIVLMDLSMPVMDGVTATRMIREQVPESQVVVSRYRSRSSREPVPSPQRCGCEPDRRGRGPQSSRATMGREHFRGSPIPGMVSSACPWSMTARSWALS